MSVHRGHCPGATTRARAEGTGRYPANIRRMENETIYLTVKEVAPRVKCDERTVRRWCQDDTHPLYLLAIRDQEGRWRIPVSWVEQWEAEHSDEDTALSKLDAPTVIVQRLLETLEERDKQLRADMETEIRKAVESEVSVVRERLDVSEQKRDQQNIEFAKGVMELRRELAKANRPWWRKLLG
jgi:hypothetical protein